MRKTNLVLMLTCSVMFFSCYAQKKADKIGVYALDERTLEINKRKIAEGEAGKLPAYKKLLKEAEKALIFGPVSVMEKNHLPPSGDKHDYMSLAPYHWPDPQKTDGLPYIRRDGETNPEVKEYKDKEYMPALSNHVYKLSLAYYFSDDEKYAAHAARLIKVWFIEEATRMNPHLNYAQAIKGVNTGRGAGLIDARHFIKVIDAIGLISHSKYWENSDQLAMQAWFSNFLNWMQTSKIGIHEMNTKNNHGVWYDALRLSIALFTKEDELARNVIVSAQERLDKQMNADGYFPYEMQRTTSLHYTVFVMDAYFNIAQMAEKIDVDFWNYISPKGNSLQKGFKVLVPYIANKKVWEGQQIKTYDLKEGYQLLGMASSKLNCNSCKQYISDIAGEDASQLLSNLIY